MTKEEKKAVKATETLIDFCKAHDKCCDCILKYVTCNTWRRFPSEWDKDVLYSLEKE